MGWTTFLLGQAFLTSVSIGALKRSGAIVFDASKIKNDTVRLVVGKAITAGEDVSEMAEKYVKQAYDQISASINKK